MGLAADGRVFWAKNDLSSPKRICLLQTENMSSSHREYVFSTQKICLLQTENMSSSDREYVFFRQRICLLQTENMSSSHRKYVYYMGDGGEVPGSIPGRCGDEKLK